MKFLRRLGCLVLLAILGGGYALYRAVWPYQGFSGAVFVEVPRGTSSGGVADLLAKQGVVRSRWDFLLARSAARFTARGSVLQAGEYKFDRPASPMEIVDRMARGDVFYYTLAVPEGQNMFDIAADLEKLGLGAAAGFLAAARNPAMIRDLDPRAPTLEGYLFPSTYKLGRNATPESICRLMTDRFREVWRGLNTQADVHRTITLASLVEREGKLPQERPMIAAVFENRLRIGMKLDCDPTTIYAAILAGRYRGAIYRSDLDSPDPYNTYRNTGLPPGPIANPGTASINAALHPADTEALYFVLRPDGSGSHEFSTSIAAHQAATERYRHGKSRVR
jgi:UPF0755 protein